MQNYALISMKKLIIQHTELKNVYLKRILFITFATRKRIQINIHQYIQSILYCNREKRIVEKIIFYST